MLLNRIINIGKARIPFEKKIFCRVISDYSMFMFNRVWK